MNSIEYRSRPCALLVDANAGYRQALSDVLLTYFPSIDVEEAGNKSEALSKVECLRPNIIFIDIQLPEENGLDLSKKIKEIYNDIVTVILTTNNLPGYHQKASQYGADYYISKSNDSCMEEILIRIEEILEGGRPN